MKRILTQEARMRRLVVSSSLISRQPLEEPVGRSGPIAMHAQEELRHAVTQLDTPR
jgi:hypothetical protein